MMFKTYPITTVSGKSAGGVLQTLFLFATISAEVFLLTYFFRIFSTVMFFFSDFYGSRHLFG